MDYRVEQLARAARVSVDTVRFYQARGLLPSPRREGRVAWYDDEHVARLARIRQLQSRGLSLATIRRLVDGELDSADEALVEAMVVGQAADEGAPLTIAELADRSGIPMALLQAVEREGLLIPRTRDGEPSYTASDADVAKAGLRLLERGLPLPEILELAREHHLAMRAIAEQAVRLFDDYIRQPLRDSSLPDAEAAARLVEAFDDLLPATTALVTHHFRRILLAVAQEHIDKVGVEAELDAIRGATWPA